MLTKLATPQIRPGPAVDVQKELVKKLDVDYADRHYFDGGILNLGGILIEEMPENDDDLVDEAQLVALPTGGGFISAGAPRAARVKELGFDRLVVQNTLQTMIDSKEIEYLRLAGLPNDEWKILIEVHYYRERDMTATGFHKDTLGETLFVNLNYHMDKKVIGPEYVVNPPPSPAHDDQTKETLPKEFRDDLAVTRAKLGPATEFGAGLVDPYGYVAFVDEAIHHATPFYGHRYVTGSELKSYLENKYPAAFKEASTAYPKYTNRGVFSYFSYFSSYVDKSIISATDSSKWLAWMEIVTKEENDARRLTREDLKATMNDDEFDALLEAVGGAEGSKRTQGAPGGFYAASIPGSDPHPIRPTGKPPLKRRLSDADFRKTLPPAPADTEKRRFFRTWIRAVKTTKVEELNRRLGQTTKV
ncbi:MAG TPA: hypothetical protein VMA77_06070 [Solirubrobacteraceae bacterium]|nr:hypothetical protein [Solirubrobacteraceae bacterium]